MALFSSGARQIRVEIVGDHRGLGRSLDQSEGKLRGFGGKMKGILGGVAAAVAAAFVVDKIVDFGVSIVKEAEKAASATAQTEAVLKSMGGAANVTAGDVKNLSQQLSLKAGIDDQLIQSGQNVLLTFGNVRNEVGKGNDAFDRATKVALDMSVALDQDMKNSTIQVGKALQDPIRGLASLRRVGVQFTEQQEEQIKTMVESGDVMGAQKIILGELEKQFGGSAEAQADATARIKVAWDNFKEHLGTAILPFVEQFADWFATEGVKKLQTFSDWVGEVGIPKLEEFRVWIRDKGIPKLKELGNWVVDELVPAFQAIADWWNTTGQRWVGTFTKTAGKVIDGIGAVINQLKSWGEWDQAITMLLRGDLDSYREHRDRANEHHERAQQQWRRTTEQTTTVVRSRGGQQRADLDQTVSQVRTTGGAFVGLKGDIDRVPKRARVSTSAPGATAAARELRGVGTAVKGIGTSVSVVRTAINMSFEARKALKGVGDGLGVPTTGGIGDGPGIGDGFGVKSDAVTTVNVTKTIERMLALGGGKVAGSVGPMMAALRGRFPGLSLISGFRPGAITATGNRSYHGMGRAVDVPPSMAVFNWIRSNYGARTKELIYSPAGGRQVHNGRNHMYSGVTRAMHWDHVHWAMDRGGKIQPGWSAVYNGLGKPETLQPTDDLKPLLTEIRDLLRRGRGGDIHLHGVDQPSEAAQAVRLMTAVG